MHVRGGDQAPDIVAHILAELSMRALDPSSASGLFADSCPSRPS
jgi:hypothetical protein